MTSWTYDGINLSTFGAITVINDYLDVARKRGGNQEIPYKHGSIHIDKFYEERSLSFGIAIKVSGADDLEELMDDMKALFSSRDQKVLSNTRADLSVRTILASVEETFQVHRESYNFLKVVVIFKCASPFFRGSSLIPDNTTVIDASPKLMDVTNTGTVEECDPTIILTGPLDNVVITNTTNGSIFRYTVAIASPRVVTIQTVDGEYVATDDLSANVIGNVEYAGGESLLRLESGLNELSITSDTPTTGTIKISFYPPYL